VNDMHAIHHDRRPLLAAVLALALALVLALALAPSLSGLDVGGSAPVTADNRPASPAADPVWVSDPVAPPALLHGAR
jgi:hypothetical protein